MTTYTTVAAVAAAAFSAGWVPTCESVTEAEVPSHFAA